MYPSFEKEVGKLREILFASKALPGYEFKELEAFAQRGMDAKKRLVELLELPPDLRITTTVDAPDALQGSDFFKCLHAFIERSYHDAQDKAEKQFFYELCGHDEAGNTLIGMVSANQIKVKKREQRFSKYLNKHINPEKFEQFVQQYYKKLDPRFHKWEPFISALFELASGMRRQVVISANPLDMVISSENAGFRSCHALDGGHASGNVAYGLDPQTAIVFLRQDDPKEFPFQKIARMWTYIDLETARKFILARAYGNIMPTQQDEIANFIGSRIAKTLAIEDKWDTRAGFKYPPGKYGNKQAGTGAATPIYFDQAVTKLVTHASFEGSKMSTNRLVEEVAPVLLFTSSMCMNCGETTRHPTHLCCPKCIDHAPKCGRCNNMVRPGQPGTHEYQKRHYCQNCYDQMFFDCGGCGKRHAVNDHRFIQINVDGGHARYCEPCAKQHLFSCERCSGMFAKKDEVHIKDPKRTICKGCFTQHNYHQCDDCNDNFTRVYREIDAKGNVIKKRCTPCYRKHQAERPALAEAH